MANYLAYDILLDSEQTPESGWDDKFSSAGTQHSRQLHGAQYWRFSLIHVLTTAEFNTLFADYTAGPKDVRTLSYLTESPIATYSVIYTDAPAIVRNITGGKHRVVSELRGFKD